jgi:hypothetical protein
LTKRIKTNNCTQTEKRGKVAQLNDWSGQLVLMKEYGIKSMGSTSVMTFPHSMRIFIPSI